MRSNYVFMRCSKCEKDFEAGVEAAYRLGLQGGENRLKKTINKVLRNNNVLLRANRRLAQELFRLDKILPLSKSPSIIITLKRAKQISKYITVKALKEYMSDVIAEQMSKRS